MTDQKDFWPALFDDLGISKLFRRKASLLALAGFGVVCALLYLHNASPRYRATLLVTPVQSIGTAPNFLNQQLGSFAGFVGSSPTDSDFQLYLETMRARIIADRLSNDDSLMHTLFADQWNKVANRWEAPSGFFTLLKTFIKRGLGFPTYEWQPPAGPEVADFIAKNVGISQSRNNKIVVITLLHSDREFAVNFLSKLDEEADGYVKTATLRRTDQYIDYLTRQLEVVTIGELRQALIGTLGEQEKLKMMASADVSYAAQKVGPTFASAMPVEPRVSVVIFLGAFLGLLVGTVSCWLDMSWFHTLNRLLVRWRTRIILPKAP